MSAGLAGLLLVALLSTKDPMATATDSSASTEARVSAIEALGSSKDMVGAIDALAEALDSRNEEVREATLKALRRQLELNRFPEKAKSPSVPMKTRKNILKALRYLKDERYVGLLRESLSDPQPSIRAEAALGLSVLGAGAAEAPLIKALDDSDKEVRYFAADALGSLKTKAAQEAIDARLKVETDPTVRYSLGSAKKRQGR